MMLGHAFVRTFDGSGSERVKSRGGGGIHARDVLCEIKVSSSLSVGMCERGGPSGCGLLLCPPHKGMGWSLPETVPIHLLVRAVNVYALPNLALCLHCHQCGPLLYACIH